MTSKQNQKSRPLIDIINERAEIATKVEALLQNRKPFSALDIIEASGLEKTSALYAGVAVYLEAASSDEKQNNAYSLPHETIKDIVKYCKQKSGYFKK